MSNRHATPIPGDLGNTKRHKSTDFNFHIESNCPFAKRFLDLLDLYGFEQNVSFPTHSHGHTLDLVFTRQAEQNIVSNLSCHDPKLSDHKAVMFNLLTNKPPFQRKEISYRKWKEFDFDELSERCNGFELMTLHPTIILPLNFISLV